MSPIFSLLQVDDDWGSALELARLRNECREHMTGSTEVITDEQQFAFWREQLITGKTLAWLLREGESVVGYAILKPDKSGGWWLSCGIAEAERGRGLGHLLVRMATEAGHRLGGPVRLELWYDNRRALHVYLKAGYRYTYHRAQGDRVVLGMEHR